jgi:ketosteroid isomerase-like protein
MLLALLLLTATPDLRAEIQHAYDGYADACLHHNIRRTMAFLTDDVIWKFPNGQQQNRAQIRPGLDQWCKSLPRGTTMRFTIESVEQGPGGEAIALITLDVVKPLADGGTLASPPAHWRDTWVRNKRGWQNRIGEELAQAH